MNVAVIFDNWWRCLLQVCSVRTSYHLENMFFMLLNRNLNRKPFLKCNYNWIIMIIVISNLGKCLQSLYKKRFFQNYLKEIALTCKLHKAYMTQCSSAFTLLLHCFVFIPFTLPLALSYSNIHTSGTPSIAFTYRHTRMHKTLSYVDIQSFTLFL